MLLALQSPIEQPPLRHLRRDAAVDTRSRLVHTCGVVGRGARVGVAAGGGSQSPVSGLQTRPCSQSVFFSQSSPIGQRLRARAFVPIDIAAHGVEVRATRGGATRIVDTVAGLTFERIGAGFPICLQRRRCCGRRCGHGR